MLADRIFEIPDGRLFLVSASRHGIPSWDGKEWVIGENVQLDILKEAHVWTAEETAAFMSSAKLSK